jgi:hypothetical protein
MFSNFVITIFNCSCASYICASWNSSLAFPKTLVVKPTVGNECLSFLGSDKVCGHVIDDCILKRSRQGGIRTAASWALALRGRVGQEWVSFEVSRQFKKDIDKYRQYFAKYRRLKDRVLHDIADNTWRQKGKRRFSIPSFLDYIQWEGRENPER